MGWSSQGWAVGVGTKHFHLNGGTFIRTSLRLVLVIILVNIARVHAAPAQLNNSETKPTTAVTQQPIVKQERPAEVAKPKKQEEPKTKKVSKPKKVAVKTRRVTPKITGNKQTWMAQAGIPASQWKYVDYIVSRESSWNPRAVNVGSGACGLVQALPCSKLGPNWSNPVAALKWQYRYVTQRYGGYAGAYSFWVANSWY